MKKKTKVQRGVIIGIALIVLVVIGIFISSRQQQFLDWSPSFYTTQDNKLTLTVPQTEQRLLLGTNKLQEIAVFGVHDGVNSGLNWYNAYSNDTNKILTCHYDLTIKTYSGHPTLVNVPYSDTGIALYNSEYGGVECDINKTKATQLAIDNCDTSWVAENGVGRCVSWSYLYGTVTWEFVDKPTQPSCGDTICSPQETCTSCPQDCVSCGACTPNCAGVECNGLNGCGGVCIDDCENKESCSSGQSYCNGYNKYICYNGQWTQSENNSFSCGYSTDQEEEKSFIAKYKNTIILFAIIIALILIGILISSIFRRRK